MASSFSCGSFWNAGPLSRTGAFPTGSLHFCLTKGNFRGQTNGTFSHVALGLQRFSKGLKSFSDILPLCSEIIVP